MSMALGFLVAGVICAALAVAFDVAMYRDREPGVSGHVVLLIIFVIAAACLFMLSAATWIVSVTKAVL